MTGNAKLKPRSILISLRVPTEHLEIIDEHATADVDRSAIIKRAIGHYIQEVLCEAT